MYLSSSKRLSVYMHKSSLGQLLQLFLQLRTTSLILRIYVVQCFKLVPRLLYCNFFLFYVQLLLQLLSSIAQNVKV